jgi:hypothetical protein
MLRHAIIKQQLAAIIKSSQCDMDLMNSRTDISLVLSDTSTSNTELYLNGIQYIYKHIYTYEDCTDYTGLHMKLEL